MLLSVHDPLGEAAVPTGELQVVSHEDGSASGSACTCLGVGLCGAQLRSAPSLAAKAAGFQGYRGDGGQMGARQVKGWHRAPVPAQIQVLSRTHVPHGRSVARFWRLEKLLLTVSASTLVVSTEKRLFRCLYSSHFIDIIIQNFKYSLTKLTYNKLHTREVHG